MIYNPNSKQINDANYELTAVFLFQLSSLVTSPKFKKWLNSNESILPNFGELTHEHFRNLLSDQLDRPLGHPRKCNIFIKLDRLGQFASGIAEYICESLETKVLKKHRKFKFSQDINASILDFLDNDNLENIICLQDIPVLRTFEFWNGFHQLVRFGESRRTLTQPIGHTGFHNHLLSIPESSIAGNQFAGDLLCHDASSIRRNPNSKPVIHYDLEKYSSFIAHKFESVPPRTYSHQLQL